MPAATLVLAATALHTIDLAVVAVGLIALLAVGFIGGRGERDTRDFFVGGRRVPAWAVCLSFIATEVSAMTLIAVPAEAFRSNWNYLQLFVGSAVARVVVAALFIPAFFRFECTTIYEFLGRRFGPATRYTGSIFFLVTRTLGSAIRLYVAAMATAMIAGWYHTGQSDRGGIIAAVAVFTLVSMAFIAFGGIKAVIWTNVLQALVFIAGGAAAVVYLCGRIDGGWSAVRETAGAAGRLEVFHVAGGIADAKWLPLAVLNGFFVSLSVFGADQELMQRLLTVESRRGSQRSLLATIVVALPTVTLFLAVGTLLFVFYRQHPALSAPAGGNLDEVFPNFVATVMPAGLRGLLLLAVVMASIDSPLGSLSASFVTDLYRPLVRPDADEQHCLLVSRLSVVGFGVLLAIVAVGFGTLDELLWKAFQIPAVTSGGLLGVFLLGLLTRRGGDRLMAGSMIVTTVLMAGLLALIEFRIVAIGWTWLILIGCAATFAVGCLFGKTANGDHDVTESRQ